jgi:hypothetical protein
MNKRKKLMIRQILHPLSVRTFFPTKNITNQQAST